MKHRLLPSLLPVLLIACGGYLSTACTMAEEPGDEEEGDGAGGTDGAGVGGSGDSATGGGASIGAGGTVATGGAGTGGAGTGGAGTGGADSPYGPVSCSPVFEEACTPEIDFENQEPDGRGAIFNTVIPDPVATMQDIACTVCSILYRDPSEIPEDKHPSTIRLVLDFHGGVAQAGGDQIQFDLDYIDNYSDASLSEATTEMMGVLVHETVHLYQHYGNGGTGEGMADYVRIRTGFYEQGRRGTGGSWQDAYTTSGFFYSWLAGPCVYHMDGRTPHNKDIGYLINKALGEGGDPYDQVDSVLQAEFGLSADALWDEYQLAIQ